MFFQLQTTMSTAKAQEHLGTELKTLSWRPLPTPSHSTSHLFICFPWGGSLQSFILALLQKKEKALKATEVWTEDQRWQ